MKPTRRLSSSGSTGPRRSFDCDGPAGNRYGRLMRIWLVISMLMTGSLVSGLSAAEVELLGGRSLEVVIVAETDTHLTMRQRIKGTDMEMKLPKARIHRLRRSADAEWEVLNAKPEPQRKEKPKPRRSTRKAEKEQGDEQKQEAKAAVADGCGFRGDGSGHFPAAVPPTQWSAPLWTAPMQAKSNASPVLAGDLIITCEEPHSLVAVDAATGQERWRVGNGFTDAGVAEEAGHQTKWFKTYGWTTPTPVAKGNYVWASFGHGVVACYDLTGKRQWIHKVHVGGHSYMTAASGCLVGKSFICYMAREDWVGTVYAFDALTGKKQWETVCRISQGSLRPITVDGQQRVLLAVGELLDPQSGSVLIKDWHGMGKKGRNYGPTPVWDAERGIIVFPIYNGTSSGDKPMRAMRLTATGEPQLLWNYVSDPEPHYSGRMHGSPLIHEGVFYARRQDGFLFALDVETGDELWTHMLPGQNFSSLVRAGPHIYAFGKGEVTIFTPDRGAFKQVAQFSHGFSGFVGTPVFAGTRMYVRDNDGLKAYGK